MKQKIKRVWLVLCMAACFFALSGCSEQEDSVDVTVAEALKQQTVGLLENIASIPEQQMGLLIEQNREGGAEAVAAGLENYQSSYEELGAYVSSGEGKVEAVDGGYRITIHAVFAKRPGTFEVTLDEEMVNITSMTFNPVYTTGEKMTKALMNTLMGMGTVFIVLIFISLLIGCFRYINKLETSIKNKKAGIPKPVEENHPASPVSKEVSRNLADDLELAAVITAAIAAAENTSADGLVVRSIRRAPAGKWKRV